MAVFPIGYSSRTVPLDELRARHAAKMHPEFERRLFAYLEHKDGLLGIGGGWRDTQPDKPGFAEDGKSFHQTQTFASGVKGYCAVDLVKIRPGGVHVAPSWDDCADAPDWGLHTFIRNPPEPWHIQPIEIRGWASWVADGRPDPQPNFPLPNEEDVMRAIRFRPQGYADQFIGFSVANPDQLIRLGMDVEPLHVVPFTAAQRAAIERDLGVKLTPHKE